MKKLVASIFCAVLCVFVLTSVAGAQEPFHTTLTLPGGATNVVSWTYSNGVNRAAYSKFRVTAFEVQYGITLTNDATITITRARSGYTNAVYTAITVASNSSFQISYPTNGLWNFRNDKLLFSSDNSTSALVTVVGEEQ
ncbi:MAG: hypothetical protein EOM20_06770 [Spartobacteria bacterium]|nr:hypothetical protein [Spartobacteria bacterium]